MMSIKRAAIALLGVARQSGRAIEAAETDGALSPRKLRKAEAELMSYSDFELADLGIGRGDIPYLVRHGRPGIDDLARILRGGRE